MNILGPNGQPITVTEPIPVQAPFKVTRQLRRAYLRLCAISSINQKAGGEDRRLRRAMAFTLAKNPAFIAQVRDASHAF